MTTPAGPDHGLDPLRPELYESRLPPIDSEDILTSPYNYRQGTEFGGVPGQVQPPPHVPTAIQRLHQIYRIDPTDDGTRPDSVVAPELEGNFLGSD